MELYGETVNLILVSNGKGSWTNEYNLNKYGYKTWITEKKISEVVPYSTNGHTGHNFVAFVPTGKTKFSMGMTGTVYYKNFNTNENVEIPLYNTQKLYYDVMVFVVWDKPTN